MELWLLFVIVVVTVVVVVYSLAVFPRHPSDQEPLFLLPSRSREQPLSATVASAVATRRQRVPHPAATRPQRFPTLEALSSVCCVSQSPSSPRWLPSKMVVNRLRSLAFRPGLAPRPCGPEAPPSFFRSWGNITFSTFSLLLELRHRRLSPRQEPFAESEVDSEGLREAGGHLFLENTTWLECGSGRDRAPAAALRGVRVTGPFRGTSAGLGRGPPCMGCSVGTATPAGSPAPLDATYPYTTPATIKLPACQRLGGGEGAAFNSSSDLLERSDLLSFCPPLPAQPGSHLFSEMDPIPELLLLGPAFPRNSRGSGRPSDLAAWDRQGQRNGGQWKG